MPKLIGTVFAVNGDVSYPDSTSTDGTVNLNAGYTAQYEIDLASGDPTAKAVERQYMNGLFNWLFDNQSFDQAHGLAPWFSDYDGGYPINALVADNTTGTWQIYRSLVAGNTAITTNTANWELQLTQTEILARNAIPLGGAAGAANGAIPSAANLNAWTYSQGTWVVSTDAIAASLVNGASSRQGVLIARNTNTTVNPTTTTQGGSFFQMYLDADGYIYQRFFAVASGATTAAWTAWRTVAFLNSPVFTGTPTAPTASAGTNTTQLATMAALYAATIGFGLGGYTTAVTDLNSATTNGLFRFFYAATNNPLSGSGGALIVNASSGGYVSQTVVSFSSSPRMFVRIYNSSSWTVWREVAMTDSPAFTGTPTAPTAVAGTNTTQIATTEFVNTQLYGRLVGAPKVFSANGTYTPTAGTKAIIVEVIGGGGGGGGTYNTSSGQRACAGGGGAGGYGIGYFSSGFSSVTITIGAGGAGGAANSATSGGSGGITSFGSLLVCSGGGGGSFSSNWAMPIHTSGAPSGAATSGANLGSFSAPAGAAGYYANNGWLSGAGASSPKGRGGVQVGGTSVGSAATGFGCGGGGASTAESASGQVGGAGSSGVVIIYEYM